MLADFIITSLFLTILNCWHSFITDFTTDFHHPLHFLPLHHLPLIMRFYFKPKYGPKKVWFLFANYSNSLLIIKVRKRGYFVINLYSLVRITAAINATLKQNLTIILIRHPHFNYFYC